MNDYPLTVIEKYLREHGIVPELTEHKYKVYEAVISEIIKHEQREKKMLWQEINILKNRLLRLETSK